MTSSPLAIPRFENGKLCVADCDPHRDQQGASVAVLETDQGNPSINMDELSAAQTNVPGDMPMRHDRQGPEAAGGYTGSGATTATLPLNLCADDAACKPRATVDDSTFHDQRMGSAGSHAINDDKSSDIKSESDDHRKEIRKSQLAMHDPGIVPCLESPSLPEQKSGDAILAADSASYKLTGEHEPRQECDAIVRDSIHAMGIENALHEWGDESYHAHGSRQNELVVCPSQMRLFSPAKL